MAVTRLKRKHRKNIARANNKQRVIKQLLSTPVIKNVDVEELKAQFAQKAAPAAAAPKAETAAPAAPAGEAAAE
jgi:ribosomal protein L12E/L44/L45/RPP1/RPP2